jgi:PAS domain S-box-containing protein
MHALDPATVVSLGAGASLLMAALVASLLLYLQHRREQQLRTSEKFRLALEAAPTAMLLIDADGIIVLVNAQTEQVFGWPRAELLGRHVDTLVPARLRTASLQRSPLAASRRESLGLRQDGLEVPIEIAMTCIATPGGEFVVVSVSDITERVQAEDLQQRMSALVESAEDAIVTKSLDGIVRSWNPAAERLLGYRAQEIIGQSVLTLLPEGGEDEESMILEQIGKGQRVAHFQTTRRHKDGSLLDVSLTISPIRDRNGTVVGASKIMRDMTETRRAAEELRSVNARLEALLIQRSGQLLSAQQDLSAVMAALPSMAQPPQGRPVGASEDSASAALTATHIEQLHALLQSQNLAAMDRFAALAASLQAAMGSESFARLREAVDNLQFLQAAELLRALLQTSTGHALAR